MYFRSFFAQAPQTQRMFVIVDPVNPQTNTARSSSHTPEILNKFKEAFTHLKSLVQDEYIRLRQLSKQINTVAEEKKSALETLVATEEGVDGGEGCQDDKGAVAVKEQQRADSETKPESEPSGIGPSQSSPPFQPRKPKISDKKELLVKPFFFAEVNFMKRFLRSDDELEESALSAGESRPADGDSQARSGSSSSATK